MFELLSTKNQFAIVLLIEQGTFRFSAHDRLILTAILKKCMGCEALERTRYSLTTQKSKSMNHAFKSTYPKHSMTYVTRMEQI